MPNWVYVVCTATGEPTEIDRLRSRMVRDVRGGEEGFDGKKGEVITVFDFGGVIPMPAEEFETNYENWAVENWGVKWNAQYSSFIRHDPNTSSFQFETPWAFPQPVFEALAGEFPGVVFYVGAEEEGNAFAYAGHFNGADDFGPVEPYAYDSDEDADNER